MSDMLAIKKYSGDIDWNVGTIFKHTSSLFRLLDNLRSMALEPNIKFAFGSFTCRLNSGREIIDSTPNLSVIAQMIDKYNSFGISVRFTFSNHLIEQKDFEDNDCNEVMRYLEEKNKKDKSLENGVILVSDELRKYIRAKYPELKLTSSLYKTGLETKFVSDTSDYYNDLLDKFDVVVVDTNKIKDRNIHFLESLKDKERIEFIANNHCMKHCPNVRKHDVAVAKLQRAICDNDKIEQNKQRKRIDAYMSYCHSIYVKDSANSTLVLTDDEINMCLDMGYKHFKIQGRDASKEEFFADLSDYIFTDTEIEDEDSNHIETAKRRKY